MVRFTNVPRSGVNIRKRAGIYVRISSDPTGLRAGVERQCTDCRWFCEARDWEVAEVYEDNDASAYSGKPRKGYAKLLDDLSVGTIDAVVVWHPDRLHRSPRELEDFIDLIEKTGAAVATVTAGAYDLSTPEGRLTARIVGSVARKESEDKSRRNRRKHLELAQAGKLAGGGTRPFGYEADRLTVQPEEAELVREAVARVMAGEALHAILSDWVARGVATTTGRPWRTSVLRRMLLSGRIAGLRTHHGKVVTAALWEPIIDRQTHEELLAILGDPNRRRWTTAPTRKYLLTGGMAVCGCCGAALVARPKQGGTRCYVCASGIDFSGCGKIRRLADPIETYVVEEALSAWDPVKLSDALTARAGNGDHNGLGAELVRYEDRLEALKRAHYVEGEITRADYLQLGAELEARIENLQRQVAGRASRRTLSVIPGGDLRAWWDGASLDRRRAVLVLVLDQVVVLPAVKGRNFFDPACVRIDWKVL